MRYGRAGIPTKVLLTASVLLGAAAQEPYPRVSQEAFNARLPFFAHDPTVPLEGRIVREWKEEESVRQKIAFRGAQGFLEAIP